MTVYLFTVYFLSAASFWQIFFPFFFRHNTAMDFCQSALDTKSSSRGRSRNIYSFQNLFPGINVGDIEKSERGDRNIHRFTIIVLTTLYHLCHE